MGSRHSKNSQSFVHNAIYRTTGVLLILALLSVWILCGLYAKYLASDSYEDSAGVLKTGASKVEVIEHQAEWIGDADKAVEKDSVYELTNEEVTKNTYDLVLPGVDIPKDPFIKITGNSTASTDETSATYNLYLQVVEKDLPDTVTYEILKDWKLVGEKGTTSTYVYKDVIDSSFSGKIYILENNELKVSEKYVGNGKTFSLVFDAWLKQVNTG